ncbi:MAG: ABC transporter ATP-binding protein [Bdellovibrionales bacterium]
MSRENIFELNNIVKNYQHGRQSLSILKGLNLEVQKGQTVCVTGPSGSGKSTLLHIMGTLDQPTSGHLYFRGRDLSQFSEDQLAFLRRTRLGFVFQFHHLLNEFTALENIMIPSYLVKKPYKQSLKRAHFLMDILGLTTRQKHYPSELSGGEQQRVAIARALMNEPEVLLADEPVGNLDRDNAKVIRNLLFELHKKLTLTLITVSHDSFFAEPFSRILKLEKGQIKDINAMQ